MAKREGLHRYDIDDSGQYLNGVKHGRGEFHYSANRRYEGDWKDGKQNGHGRLF